MSRGTREATSQTEAIVLSPDSQTVAQLTAENTELKARIAELEHQVRAAAAPRPAPLVGPAEAKIDDVNKTTNGKTKAYHIAELGPRIPVTEIRRLIGELVARGADFDIPGPDGKTPTFIAAENGHHEVIRALAEAKAKDGGGKGRF